MAPHLLFNRCQTALNFKFKTISAISMSLKQILATVFLFCLISVVHMLKNNLSSTVCLFCLIVHSHAQKLFVLHGVPFGLISFVYMLKNNLSSTVFLFCLISFIYMLKNYLSSTACGLLFNDSDAYGTASLSFNKQNIVVILNFFLVQFQEQQFQHVCSGY